MLIINIQKVQLNKRKIAGKLPSSLAEITS